MVDDNSGDDRWPPRGKWTTILGKVVSISGIVDDHLWDNGWPSWGWWMTVLGMVGDHPLDGGWLLLDALCYCVVVLLPVCYFIGLLHTIHCRAVCYNVVFFKQCFFYVVVCSVLFCWKHFAIMLLCSIQCIFVLLCWMQCVMLWCCNRHWSSKIKAKTPIKEI